jgi:hypothetical protein
VSTDLSRRSYTVTWTRSDGKQQTCTGLTVTTAAARLLRALQASGPITIVSVRRERVAICGAIYPAPERDCFCFLDQGHDGVHECAAVGCEQMWTSQPARRTA